MEAWKEVNCLVPLQAKIDVGKKASDNNFSRPKRLLSEISLVSLNIKTEIQEMLSAENRPNRTILLHGEYGCGKSSVVQIVMHEITNSTSVAKSDIWLLSLDRYSTLETVFQFLANQAKEREIRESYNKLISKNADVDEKMKAVNQVLQHCKLFFLDDIDAFGEENFKFLMPQIEKNDLITVCTSTFLIQASDKQIAFEIASPKFATTKDFAEFAKEVYSMKDIDDGDLELANLFGPLFASIIIKSKGKGISKEMFSELSSHELSGLPRNSQIEKALSLIMNQLTEKDRNTLFSISLARSPLPVHDKTLFQSLEEYGLIVLEATEKGHVLHIHNSVARIVRNLLSQESSFLENHSKNFPTPLDLWKDLLNSKLLQLLSDAERHAWPFVPEAWQYKDVVGVEERYNLKDLIHRTNEFSDLEEIDILQECLYSALTMKNYETAAALVFLMDRFTYWQGTAQGTKSIVEYIEKKSKTTAIAPQLVIRKARLHKNDGDIQGAEKVLNSLIRSKGQLGGWKYQNEADYTVISSVCIQIKGDILRGLGLWSDAAHDLIKSIIGFKNLPKPDKKGWASSLSLLADSFQYMSLTDFKSVMVTRYNLRASHPLLEAISCVEEAARLSIFSPLFYSKNKRRAGELCSLYARLLPPDSSERASYLFYAATECLEGLRCHTSISSLESREQYYEFVYCVYKLSRICRELQTLPAEFNVKIDAKMTEMLDELAIRLYDHYGSSQMRFQHNKWSSALIQTTLELLHLPKIPDLERLQPLPSTLQRNTDKTPSAVDLQASTKEVSRVDQVAEHETGGDVLTQNKTVETQDLPTDDEGISSDMRNADTVLTFDTKEAEKSEDSGFREAVTAPGTVEQGIKTEDDFVASASPDGVDGSDKHDMLAHRLLSTEDFPSLDSDANATNESYHMDNVRNMATIESAIFDIENLKIPDDGNLVEFRKEKTSITDSGESNTRESRLLQTMATLEERNTSKATVLDQKLSIIRHSRTGRVHNARAWRYDPLTRDWSYTDTLAYVGDLLILGENIEGACRDVYMFEYINQEEPMSKYIGKQYKKLDKYKERIGMQQYKQDIVCQVTSRHYVTLFNQQMYRKGLAFGQVQYLPAVLVELLDVQVENELERYFNVEPYMAGNFVKITNNYTHVTRGKVQGKDLLLAFSHFSYCASQGNIIIVDIQGWTSPDQSGGTFLTDPQIHTHQKKGFGTANRGADGFKQFWVSQHPKCNDICKALNLERPDVH